MKYVAEIAIVAMLTLGAPFAHAVPILVDPTAQGSSVTITITEDCLVECWATTILEGSLNGAGYELDVDDGWAFDFFEITVGGLGSADAIIQATLAFLSPEISVSGTGYGGFFTFFGLFSGGSLFWDQPATVELGDGTSLNIAFENLHDIGFGSSTIVSASVSRYGSELVELPTVAVSEPGTLALFGAGLLILAGVFRRRRTAVSADL